MCDRLCECIHACVANTACVGAYATARILVWQIMHMCGRYGVCSRICDHVPCMHAYVADYATACMPVWQIVQCGHACMADYAIACMPVWHIPLVKQNVADCATACEADYAAACVPVWRIMQCGHACVADCAPACMPV